MDRARDTVWIEKTIKEPGDESGFDTYVGAGVFKSWSDKVHNGIEITLEDVSFAEDCLTKQIPDEIRHQIIRRVSFSLSENTKKYVVGDPRIEIGIKWLNRLLEIGVRKPETLSRLASMHAANNKFEEARDTYTELLKESIPEEKKTDIIQIMADIGLGDKEYKLAQKYYDEDDPEKALEYIDIYGATASGRVLEKWRRTYKNLRAKILVGVYKINRDENLRLEAVALIEQGKKERDTQLEWPLNT